MMTFDVTEQTQRWQHTKLNTLRSELYGWQFPDDIFKRSSFKEDSHI